MTYTISEMARRFGLSRSTLLYYDKLGLLTARCRTRANYRVYSDEDVERLSQVCMYREMGVPLKQIKEMLGSDRSETKTILEERLATLNYEIHRLRGQQQVILNLLQDEALQETARALTKERWVGILRATGLDEEAMHRWHREFEASAPEAHQDFLESLGLDATEVRNIRKRSRL